MIDENGESGRRKDDEFHPKGVVIRIVRRLEVHVDEIDGDVGGHDKDDFHRRVVDRDEIRHQIEIARREDHREQYLTFTRYACNEPRRVKERQCRKKVRGRSPAHDLDLHILTRRIRIARR